MFDFVHYFCLYKEFSLIMHFLVCSLSPYAYIKRRWQGWKQRREKRQLRCVCVRACTCVCVCVPAHVSMHACTHMYICVCVCVAIFWIYVLIIFLKIFYRNSGSKWKMRLAMYIHTLVTGISCNTNLYTKIKPTGAYCPVKSKDQ